MEKKDIEAIKDLIAERFDPEMLFADGLEDAIIGVVERCSQPPLVVYDIPRCIEILMERDGMSHEDAEEFFSFNTLGAWVGEYTPVYMTPLSLLVDDLDDKPRARILKILAKNKASDVKVCPHCKNFIEKG